MKRKRARFGFKLILFSLLLIPAMQVLFIIGCNSNYLIRKPFFVLICIINIILFICLFYGLKLHFEYKGSSRRRLKKQVKAFITTFMLIYIFGCTTFILLLYGPSTKFKNWLITTAMQTMNHQYYCKWFYSDKQISEILDNNYVEESGESTDTSLINKDNKEPVTYENEYEEAILKRDKNEKYKIIELDVNGCKGYLAVIYDPSKVKLAVTKNLGVSGQLVTKMAEDHKAVLAINGGGFYDPGNNSAGGTPNGYTISYGRIITNGEYGVNTQSGGIIGFTEDNVLVLLKNTTAKQALEQGVRDAVTWGPFLIVNGKPSFIKGNGGWGYAARSAIGQRADGIVLLLAINSNATRTKGADMVDLTEIMQKYGAINAANLDGGTSTVMVLPKNQAQKYRPDCADNYCYINDPIDGDLLHRTRAIADAWIVEE